MAASLMSRTPESLSPVKEPYEPFGIFFHKGKHQHAFRILEANCHAHPDRVALIWNDDTGREERRVTYGELLKEVGAVALFLTRKSDPARKMNVIFADSGARALLTSKEYLKVVQAASVTTTYPYDSVLDLNAYQERWWSTDAVPKWGARGDDDFKFPTLPDTGEALAFLQYTSGSTGQPKGVMIKHGNLVTNSALITEMFAKIGDGTQNLYTFLELVIVSWLPTFHDMGLIGFHVAPLLIGTTVSSMSPLAFIQNPLAWLKMIGRYKRTITGAPPFALELCAKKATPADLREIDLSRLDALLVGAEPVRDRALQAFQTVFGVTGFDEKKYMPCYGLAENVLFAAGKKDMSHAPHCVFVDATKLATEKIFVPLVDRSCSLSEVERSSSSSERPMERPSESPMEESKQEEKKGHHPVVGRWLVSSGEQMGSGVVSNPGRVLIVDPATHVEVEDGTMGEIWIAGKSKASGYWKKPEATASTFQAELKGTMKKDSSCCWQYPEWLRTGDMGCWYKDQLYITGRIKEMIIINGHNLYPQDIEEAVKGAHVALRPGSITAFAVEAGSDNDFQEHLTVVVEVNDRAPPDPTTAGASSSPSSSSSSSSRTGTGVTRSTTREPVKKGGFLLNALALVGSSPIARRCANRLLRRFRGAPAVAPSCATPPGSHLSASAGSHSSASATFSTVSTAVRTAPRSGYTVQQLEEISTAVRRAVLTTFGLAIADLVVVQARTIKKTSSGKNCRIANREALLRGEFDHAILKRSRTLRPVVRVPSRHPVPDAAAAVVTSVPEEDKRTTLASGGTTATSGESSASMTLEEVKAKVIAIARHELDELKGGQDNLDEPEELDESKSLGEYGLDSLSAAKLTTLLQKEFKVPLTVFMFLSDPTIRGVSTKILQALRHHAASPPTLLATSLAPSTGTIVREWSPVTRDRVAMVLGIGTAVPPRSGGPEEAETVLANKLELVPGCKKRAQLHKIVVGTKIDRRHMVFDNADDVFFGRSGVDNDEGVEARNAVFKREAVKLSVASAEKALRDWGGRREDITHVIGVTCTGVIIPGLEFHVMQGCALSTTCERLSVTFMGCFGALSAMKTAKALARENPRNRVLLVCTELCSVHMQLKDTVENMVASCLFADGSASMVVGQQPRPRERPLFELHHSASHIIPNTLAMMAWELSKSGMVIGLDKHIPGEIFTHIASFSDRLLPGGVSPKECIWAIHPGGPMVLQAIIDALHIDVAQTQSAWDVLRNYGNMSSGTLIFVLDQLRRDQEAGRVARGTWIPALAFGPGLNVEGAVLRACGKRPTVDL